MQFIWRYIDDMVGKGIEMTVLAEMFFYAALSLVPMALPLSILLASLMTFGNLGERLELLAMKSAGVSLLHIMRPLIITIGTVSVFAFFFQNNILPVAQVKLYSLLYSIRAKSPELDIPEGVFYKDITGFNVYVKSKDNRTGRLNDMMIYDYSDGFNNLRVILADSGRLKTSVDKLFLVLTLYNGESFENMRPETVSTQKQVAIPYRRESFTTKEILIEFDANFQRTDESFMQNQFMGKNLKDLQTSIDSMSLSLDSVKQLNGNNTYTYSYRKSFSNPKEFLDSTFVLPAGQTVQSLDPALADVDFYQKYTDETPGRKAAILSKVKGNIENIKADSYMRAATVGSESNKVRRHITEWHKKFTIPFACLVFFFIGAPLGAIIRKGGLGVPVVISVLLFIFYYIIDNMGFKMARDGIWPAWQGMWLSAAVLTPMGVFLTYKAVNDSVILNADTYINAFKNFIGKRSGRKIDKKEVIIYNPDYQGILPRLKQLIADCDIYLSNNKRWLNYFTYWRQGGRDLQAEVIAKEEESIVEELANSDQNLVLNKLMDYPIIGGYNQLSANLNPKIGIAIGLFLPLGIPVYFLAIYQRKLLRQDIQAVKRTSSELIEMTTSL